ncbi:hypothetical protein BMS3Abin09_00533 [bacterium BMS3Abin09]|nr:hypothetical protein BMS3Abin09_00533 [bacterium BMS3Abin09]
MSAIILFSLSISLFVADSFSLMDVSSSVIPVSAVRINSRAIFPEDILLCTDDISSSIFSFSFSDSAHCLFFSSKAAVKFSFSFVSSVISMVMNSCFFLSLSFSSFIAESFTFISWEYFSLPDITPSIEIISFSSVMISSFEEATSFSSPAIFVLFSEISISIPLIKRFILRTPLPLPPKTIPDGSSTSPSRVTRYKAFPLSPECFVHRENAESRLSTRYTSFRSDDAISLNPSFAVMNLAASPIIPLPLIPDDTGVTFLERFAVMNPLLFVFCSFIIFRALVISPWFSTTAAPSLSPSIASMAVSYSAGASNISET